MQIVGLNIQIYPTHLFPSRKVLCEFFQMKIIILNLTIQLEIMLYNLIKIMRSLFTTDIPGAVPTNRYYDKHLYFERHLKEVERFGPKNPEHKRVFEWHQPVERKVEPIDKNSSIVKPHNYNQQEEDRQAGTGLSRSVILTKKMNDEDFFTGKVTQGISTRRQSSVLSNAAKKSLSESFSKDYSQNPYFPHMMPRFNGDNKSKLTGRRDWTADYNQQIQIPAAHQQYFPKWS